MPAAPLSSCRRAGDLLLLSGQLGVRDGALVDGIAEQTRQTIRNVETVLAEHGESLADVVRTTVYLTSMTHWPAMNEVYGALFPEPYPARSAVALELIGGALVEVEATAYVPLKRG